MRRKRFVRRFERDFGQVVLSCDETEERRGGEGETAGRFEDGIERRLEGEDEVGRETDFVHEVMNIPLLDPLLSASTLLLLTPTWPDSRARLIVFGQTPRKFRIWLNRTDRGSSWSRRSIASDPSSPTLRSCR